ncbi:MAG: branched-chain amino acid ABC transporter permease [Chloroflexi bacterium]|nr:branched-chain amino acid ABC transporter permease [Chloroflexota bacterium]
MVNYVAQILIVVAIAAILAGSLNLVLGYGGVFSVVHAAFFGIGAYTTAQLALLLGTPFPLDMIASFAVAALFAALVGPPIARLSDEYVIVGTLALQLVLFNVFLNWQAVTGGSYGLFGVPRPTVPFLNLTSLVDFAIFSVIIVALCYLLLWWLVRSPFGLALKGLREDPLLSQSFGKDVNRQRTIAFAIGSGVAGVAGMLYARYVGYIDPHTFNIDQSLTTVTVLVVGGLANLGGTLGVAVHSRQQQCRRASAARVFRTVVDRVGARATAGIDPRAAGGPSVRTGQPGAERSRRGNADCGGAGPARRADLQGIWWSARG